MVASNSWRLRYGLTEKRACRPLTISPYELTLCSSPCTRVSIRCTARSCAMVCTVRCSIHASTRLSKPPPHSTAPGNSQTETHVREEGATAMKGEEKITQTNKTIGG